MVSEAKRLRVVIVDDNPLLLAAMRRLLAPRCVLEVVSTAEEARALLGAWMPDVVVADLRLGSDPAAGLEVLRAARETAPAARRVLMTGAVPPPAAHTLAHHVVQKPMEPRDFFAALGIEG